MATDTLPNPASHTVDLTGLPDDIVRDVTELVRNARAGRPVAPLFVSRPRPSAEESQRLLERMASRASGLALPPDFSRSDLYDEHD